MRQTLTESTEYTAGPQNLSADPDRVSVRACRTGAILLAILFFLLHLPSLSSLSHWRGDERFYTDAAVIMTQTGDYLTPIYPDGSLRFKKPIVPYWCVLFGFRLFGFNYFASRIAFLVAGASVVWLGFEVCQALTRRSREALVAAAIVVSNLTVHSTSIRSTPDMLLCAFALTSLLGFINLLFRGKATRWYALAYLGAGFAVATKGLSGLLPVIYVFLFAAISRSRVRLRDLLHPVFIPVAALIGSAWFIWAFSRYGSIAEADFFGDQVGERFYGSKIYILKNAAVYFGSFIVQLLPWSLVALVAFAFRRGVVLKAIQEHRAAFIFAGGWVLFLFLIFTWGNIQRTRYFLPGYPFLALAYSFSMLAVCADAKANSILEVVRKIFYAIALVGGILLAVFGFRISPGLGMGGLVLAASAAVLGWWPGSWSPAQRIISVAIYILLVFSVDLLIITPVFRFSAAPAMTRRFSSGTPDTTRNLPMAGMDVAEASQMRLLSKGELNTFIILPSECEAALNTNAYVICTERVLQTWRPENVTIERCGTGSVPWKLRDYLALCRARDGQAFLKSKEVPYFLVSKKVPTTPN
jgi:4-amino-4-deoxy-L-arabinose transferase-like glycosyltransferase